MSKPDADIDQARDEETSRQSAAPDYRPLQHSRHRQGVEQPGRRKDEGQPRPGQDTDGVAGYRLPGVRGVSGLDDSLDGVRGAVGGAGKVPVVHRLWPLRPGLGHTVRIQPGDRGLHDRRHSHDDPEVQVAGGALGVVHHPLGTLDSGLRGRLDDNSGGVPGRGPSAPT